ncbi:MAG: methyltransferase domain-containing protein [Acidobacteriota bacterium]|nr:methyltransferase domain-containing protein [Acidobacteriota bacterium]
MNSRSMQEIYAGRRSHGWAHRLYRVLQPPAPFIRNPAEPLHFPLGRWNLCIGGAGSRPEGYVNLDLFPLPGVDVAADAEHLPFPNDIFQCIECDAVLEHVRDPGQVLQEIARVLAPGGHAHVVTPFCHPFHRYPEDYRRFTPDGLKLLAGAQFDVVAEGWRTGPTATLLVFVLEYVKLWFPWRAWRIVAHGVLGWLLFPLRYLDLLFFRSGRSGVLGNHCYLWLRKR